MKCRGWRGPHEATRLVHVTWSYDGARHVPSSYFMCDRCADAAEAWVRELELRRGFTAHWRRAPIYCGSCDQTVDGPGPWCDLYYPVRGCVLCD